MVFYFTGTGNSLYAAKQLETDPISIPQVIDEEKLDFTAKTIGIVCPVYGHEVPAMVQEFLRKASFHTDYFYMVLTYGNRHGGAAELAEQLCVSCGIRPAYINVLLMVDNWLPGFDMVEQRRLDKQVEQQIAAIQADICAQKKVDRSGDRSGPSRPSGVSGPYESDAAGCLAASDPGYRELCWLRHL